MPRTAAPPQPQVTEFVQFRIFRMPCCRQQLCWVNPRLPNYCPECGTKILVQMRSGEFTLYVDKDAHIRYRETPGRLNVPAVKMENFVEVSEADLALIAEEIKLCWGGITVTHLLSIYAMIYISAKEGGDTHPNTYKALIHIATTLGFVPEFEEPEPPTPSDLRKMARNRFLLTDICEYKENKSVPDKG